MDVPVASLLEYLLGQLGIRDSDRVSHPDVLHETPTDILVPEEVVSPLVGRVHVPEVVVHLEDEFPTVLGPALPELGRPGHTHPLADDHVRGDSCGLGNDSAPADDHIWNTARSEEHTSELQSLMRIS